MRLVRPTVLPLTEVGGSDRAMVGGKAAMLGELRRRGFAVPDGVVLTAVGRHVGSLPAEVVDALDAARVRFGGCVAVRSSALDEDTPTSSAAGRYPTVLAVTDRAGLLTAVNACLVSARPTGAPMAVLVQPMVAATVTGVAFTADPVTGERDVVVVVAGEPGTVTEGGDGRTWRLQAARVGGTGHPATPAVGADAMTAALVRAVASAAVGAAAVVGGPADVEWAAHQGQVTLLQARPMTALPEPVRWQAPLPGGWLRNFRIGEWLPGPVSPLFESWFLDVVELGVRTRARREAGLVMSPPLHVTVGGWYFHAPMGANSMRTLRRAVLRNPRFVIGGVLVRRRPEWTERLVARRFARAWRRAVLPAHLATAATLRRRVEQPGPVGPVGLVAAVEAVVDQVAAVMWSLSMVGGFAWKVEACVRRLLQQRLPPTEAQRLASLMTQPQQVEPAKTGLSSRPRSVVHSLDWIHPPIQLAAVAPAGFDDSPAPPDRDAARAALGRRRWRRIECLAELARHYASLREEQAAALTEPWPQLRQAVIALGSAATDAGVIADPADVWFLHRRELMAALAIDSRAAPPRPEVDVGERRRRWQQQHLLTPPLQLGELPRPVAAMLPDATAPAPGALVTGEPGSPGRATGRVVLAADLAAAARLETGDVLVTPLVTPAWLPVVTRAGAVVTDGGTVAAHAALVCRELRIPFVLATQDATRRLLDGETVTVDGSRGAVMATS